MNLDIRTRLNIRHALRRDEHKLPTDGLPRGAHQHPHANVAIDIVHEDVKLVQTANRRAHGLPEREEETDCGKGLFAAREGLGLPALVRVARFVRLDFEVESFVVVVDDEGAAETAC